MFEKQATTRNLPTFVSTMMKQFYLFLSLVLVAVVQGFVPLQSTSTRGRSHVLSAADGDSNEVVGRRIKMKGDVNGGYFRSCVLNEVGDATDVTL